MATVSKVEPTKTGNRPQLLNTIEESDARLYAASHNWVTQEKHDGERRMIFRKAGKLSASNKLGFETMLDSRIEPAFVSILKPFTVDGEQVGDTFFAFDLLVVDGIDMRQRSYQERYAKLSEWLPKHPSVKLVESFYHDATIIDTLKAKGAEGVVFKRLTSNYEEGRPNSGGNHFKFKFQNTASFICTGQNGSKNSVHVALLDENGNEVPMGKCTIPANQKVPAAGTIVEVRYLYAYRGGSIFQPCYLGERNDILRAECKTTQLKFKGEGTEEE